MNVNPAGTGSARVLMFIIALALTLRLWGINFGLPYLYHADEPIVVNHALAYGTGDLNPHFFRIPPLTSYLLFAVYGCFYAAGLAVGAWQNTAQFSHFFLQDPTAFYLAARILFGAVMGTAGVYALYALMLRHFDERSAILGALLLSCSFLHVRDSHYIYADIPMLTAGLCAFSFILKVAEDPSRRTHLLAGTLLGIACAFKYNAAAFAIPYIAALSMNTSCGWSKKLQRAAEAGLTSLAVFAVLNPYALLDWRFFLSELHAEGQARLAGTPLLHHFTYSLAGSLGWPQIVLGFLGFMLTLLAQDRARSRKVLITGIFIGAYYVILIKAGQPYDRYVLPIVPFITLLAAIGILETGRSLKSGSALSRITLTFLTVLAVSFPLAKSCLAGNLMASPDIRTTAKLWVETHVPADRKIALDTKLFMPPLQFSEQALTKKQPASDNEESGQARKMRYEFLLGQSRQSGSGYDLYFLHELPFPENPGLLWGPFAAFDLGALRRQGIEYVITAGQNTKPPEAGSFSNQLMHEADLVKRFSPYRSPDRTEPYDAQALTAVPFLWSELMDRYANGHTIFIYRLRGAADADGRGESGDEIYSAPAAEGELHRR